MPVPAVLQWMAIVALSALLTGVFTRYARRRGMFDFPRGRHSHTEPTPRGGGAGIVVSFVIAILLQQALFAPVPLWTQCMLPGLIALSLTGWRDDQVSLPAGFRFGVQVLVSSYLLWCFRLHGLDISSWPLLAAGFYLLWMTNLYNFMDGSNGMAGFQGVFAGLTLASLFSNAGDGQSALISLLLAAACIGFLPWNLGRARVFMGDVASGPLGFVFAALLIYGVFQRSFSAAVAWLVMLVFMCDSTLTLIARVLRGERWYNPHKQHLYQRLIACGWSHGSVLLLYQTVNVVFVVPAIVVAVNFPAFATPVALVVTMVLGLSWLLTTRRIGVLA